MCGSNGITYSSVCRLVLETDDVYPIYDGPCNQTECQNGPVSTQLSLVAIVSSITNVYNTGLWHRPCYVS